MGGTFNPIHMGHLLMARFAKEYAELDAVLFIPAGKPYMKNTDDLLDGSHRLYMVQQSISAEKDFYVSSIEIDRTGYTYTYETIEDLYQKYTDSKLYFILGADSLHSFEHWLYPERILARCSLIAASRNGALTEELVAKKSEITDKFGGEILLMEFPTIDISSTLIRDRVREGKSIRYFTTDFVCNYIEENGFYLS